MEARSSRRARTRGSALAAAVVGTLAATSLAAALLAASPAEAVGSYSAPTTFSPGSTLADADGVAVVGTTTYVLDGAGKRVYALDATGAVVSTATMAGAGPAGLSTTASDLAATGSLLYIADTGNSRVVSIPLPLASGASTPTLSAVAGTGTAGPQSGTTATASKLNYPQGLAVDSAGALYIADTANNQIDKVSGGTLTIVAGNGSSSTSTPGSTTATGVAINGPRDVAVDPGGNLFVIDADKRVSRVDATTSQLTTLTTLGATVSGSQPITVDAGTLFIGTGTGVTAVATTGGTPTDVASGLTSVQGLAVNGSGEVLIGDAAGGSSRVARIAPAGGAQAPVITSTPPTTAVKGSVLSQSFTANGFPAPTWSIFGAAPASITGLAIGARTGLLTGTPTTAGSYSFVVRAENSSGHYDQTVTLLVGSAPAAVAKPTAVAGQGTATLTWVAPAASTATGEGVTGYVITPYAGATAGTAKTVSATTLSTTLTGLKAGTAYTFTVAATNGFGASAASPASAAVTPYGGITEPQSGLTRYQGSNRVMTAVKTSQQLFPDTGSARAVVLASSTSFADSLAGARLASAVGAPLLLTDPAALNTEVAAEVTRVLAAPTTTATATTTRATTLAAADAVTTAKPTAAGTVYLLGGTGAVSAAVETAVKAAAPKAAVTRLSGADRYETAVKIAAQVALDDPVAGAPLYVASGRDFPDGLAVAALAARTGGPVLLTDGATMPASTLAFLQTYDPNSELLVAVGGPAARATSGHGADRAIVGADRYDTARLVAARFTAQSGAARVRDVGLATGENWPDALAGAAAMGNLDGPLLLTPSSSLSPAVGSAVTAVSKAGRPSAALVFGGPSVVSSGTADAFAALVTG